MRVLLVKPGRSTTSVDLTAMTLIPSLGLEIIASSLLAVGHEVRIVDLRLEQDLDLVLRDYGPAVVGITAFCTEVERAREVASVVKAWGPDTLTVVGGHHATMSPQDFLSPHIDYLVQGEGETTIIELLDAHAEGETTTREIPGTARADGCGPERRFTFAPPRPFVADLEAVPMPARDLTSHYRPHYRYLMWSDIDMVETARGCPYRCDYCSIWRYYKGLYRTFRVERVVRDFCGSEADNIIFTDDDFLVDPDRTRRICASVAAEGVSRDFLIGTRSEHITRDPGVIDKLCRIGLNVAYFGAETARYRGGEIDHEEIFNDNNAEALRILQDHGVATWVGFVVDPAYSHADFDLLENYLDRLGITFPQFTILTPLPGTTLYERRAAELVSHDLNNYDFLHIVLPTRLPREEFCERFARLYRRSYLAGGKILGLVRGNRARGLKLSNVMNASRVLRRLADPRSYESDHLARATTTA